jgi:hypothetical protein
MVLAVAAAIVLALVAMAAGLRYLKKHIRKGHYKQKWQDLQKFLASKETWPLAVITADKLLDEALKKKGMKGKSTGERLVTAQRELSNNDSVWFAHNLAKKLMDETTLRLKQTDVKKSLLGFLQALKDLGVME